MGQFIKFGIQAFDRIFFCAGISSKDSFQAVDDMGFCRWVIDNRENMNDGLILMGKTFIKPVKIRGKKFVCGLPIGQI